MASIKVDDPKHLLDQYGVEHGDVGPDGWLMVLCPFHNDTVPSCAVNLDSQQFLCHACEAKGDLIDFLAGQGAVSRAAVIRHVEMLGSGGQRAKVIAGSLVTQYHRALVNNKNMLEWLSSKKGVSMKSVLEEQLGWDGYRVIIPILNTAEEIVNLRKHSPDPSQAAKKVINVRGHGKRMLYPIKALKEKRVVLTEGELKTLMLRERGFNALTGTGGAGTWASEWNEEFKDKEVVIIYDIDKKGIVSAHRVARQLHPYAKQIKVVQLPMLVQNFPHGDVTDYIIEMGHTVEDLIKLIEDTLIWEVAPLMPEIDEDQDVYPMSLSETSLASHYHKFVETEVVVSAKDTAPYIIPSSFIVRCNRGEKDVCLVCSVNNAPQGEELKIDDRHPAILKMVGVSDDQMIRIIRQIVGIPTSCSGSIIQVKETRNIEEIRLIPQLEIAATEQQHVVRRAFYVGHGIETNASFIMRARVVPEPSTQYATLLVYEIEQAIDSLSTFSLTPELHDSLKVFQPSSWTASSINEKLEELYNDLEANVTRIYQRRDLHLFYDLIWHSVLYIKFQDKVIKGWVEGIVLGDSGQGKSETARCLRDHYKLGEKIDAKGSSVAGLIGGLQDTAKRWFITWGVITLNDRRLVILEEVKGMSPEVIAKLTEVRSSGVAEVAKIEKMRANARTRLIWISNPRSEKLLCMYNYGVEALRELIGSPEDIRRFDMSILVGSGDVDRRFLNIRDDDRPCFEHRHTSELCKNLVLWSWSRGIDDVELSSETVDLVLDVANEMGESYCSQIPLVEAADQRLKIVRLSAALAARTFSTEDGKKLIVRPCHVEAVAQFLDRVYSARACGYKEFSTRLAAQNSLRNPDEVYAYMKILTHAQTVVQSFLNAAQFNLNDVMDWTEQDRDGAKQVLGFLVRNNAIARQQGGVYIKLPQFIQLLKELESEKLTDKKAGEEEEF